MELIAEAGSVIGLTEIGAALGKLQE